MICPDKTGTNTGTAAVETRADVEPAPDSNMNELDSSSSGGRLPSTADHNQG